MFLVKLSYNGCVIFLQNSQNQRAGSYLDHTVLANIFLLGCWW